MQQKAKLKFVSLRLFNIFDDNPGAKIAAVAREFDVPRSRLRRRLQRISTKKDSPAHHSKLSDEEETALCQYIDKIDSINFAVRPEYITDATTYILRERASADIERVQEYYNKLHMVLEAYKRKTVEELLLQIQAQVADMTAFEQTGLQQIRRISSEAERACDFQTLLFIQPAADEKEKAVYDGLFANNRLKNTRYSVTVTIFSDTVAR
ncbi:hypothetical protein QQS21_002508 [Conoideocrella luteorostrata]|uniref:HTH psq-type domain-containing protein n=1 Tax=Conoideocrella luteorostrata TaxID=1105319 RepID=A0AAJ0CV03_9HYPO|nr:hypothetical protein QQS21_002508 [Conoideocrella luteorostrata]